MLCLFVWFCQLYRGSFKSLLTRRCQTLCFTKLNSTRSPQSHPCLNGFFLTESLLLLFHVCAFLSQLSELVRKLAEEIRIPLASKRFPSFGPPDNGNENKAKISRFHPNRNLTGTIHHWSVILRRFSVVSNSTKRDANGFFKGSYSPLIFWFRDILSENRSLVHAQLQETVPLIVDC